MGRRLCLVFTLGIGIWFSSPAAAAIQVTINGSGAPSLVQGDSVHWVISGLAPGATVTNQVWVDGNGNGTVDATDLLLISFSETDGAPGGGGPTDQDGAANGVITTLIPTLSFPAGHLLFVTSSGAATAKVAFAMAALPSPTFTLSGHVLLAGGGGVKNIVINASPQGTMGAWFTLTDNSGAWSVATNATVGSQWNIGPGTEEGVPGYVVSPGDTTVTVTGNISGLNFTLTPGKVITGVVKDSAGTPLGSIRVNVMPMNGGSGPSAQTDASGRYYVNVGPGSYTVQFGSRNDTEALGREGYVVAYYNQKYSMPADSVVVTSSSDTVKNINAVLRRGGVISGRVTNQGFGAGDFCVMVYPYNVSGNPAYGNCYSPQYSYSNQGYYQIGVLPGTYTVQFSVNTGSSNGTPTLYYDRSRSWPGTPVTIARAFDTAKGIGIDARIAPVKGAAAPLVARTMLSVAPNPVSGSTTIRYSLGERTRVNLTLYNYTGEAVRTFVAETQAPGAHAVRFSTRGLPAGYYIVKIRAGSIEESQRISLLKK